LRRLVARDDTGVRKIPSANRRRTSRRKKFSLDVNEFTAESDAVA